jgi:hypothetical protein
MMKEELKAHRFAENAKKENANFLSRQSKTLAEAEQNAK